MTAKTLQGHVQLLAKASAAVPPPEVCRTDIVGVLEACRKYLAWLATQRDCTKKNDARTTDLESEMRVAFPRVQSVGLLSKYAFLRQRLSDLRDYVAVEITDETMRLKDDGKSRRDKRRNYFTSLTMPFPTTLCRVRVGGPYPQMAYIWRMPKDVSKRDPSQHAKLISRFERERPIFKSRAQRRELMARFSGLRASAAPMQSNYEPCVT